MKLCVVAALFVGMLTASIVALAPTAFAAVSDAAFAALDARVRVLETMMGVPTPTPVPTATGTATAFPTASPTASPTPSPTTTPAPVAMNRATLLCGTQPVYQRIQIDPIVQFGVWPSMHLHDFYGRAAWLGADMSAVVTDPPVNGDPGYTPFPTTCGPYGHWAAYWFPTSKWNGVDITPIIWNDSIGQMITTYQAPVGVTVDSPPFGMAYVVGGGMGSTTPQPHVRFTCGDIDGPGSPTPTNCTSVGGKVTAELVFPDCFDGQTALGVGGFPAGIAPAHFAYSVNGACPSSHAVRIAQLVTEQQFLDPRTNAQMVNPFNADGTLGLSFASGGPLTYHGDFMNLWAMFSLYPFVNECLNQNTTPLTNCNQ